MRRVVRDAAEVGWTLMVEVEKVNVARGIINKEFKLRLPKRSLNSLLIVRHC
jgi:hypothetical protein